MRTDPHRSACRLLPAACALAAMFAGGCSASRQWSEMHEIPAAPLAVDVSNFRGDVTIRVKPELSAAEVRANLDVSTDVNNPAHSTILSGATVESTLERTEAGSVLRVRTASPLEDQAGHDIDLTLLVPRCDGLRVTSAGGDVVVVGAGGAMQIDNRRGSIEVRTAQPITEQTTLTAVDGNIYFQVPPDSALRFDLETLNGESIYIEPLGRTTVSYGSNRVFRGILNDGSADVLCRTNNGNIRVYVFENPEAWTRTVKRDVIPDVRTDPWMNGPTRYLRDLPDDSVTPRYHDPREHER